MKAILVLLLLPLGALGSEGVRLDSAQINPRDLVSVQRGAQVFVNYCLNCHSAAFMRYNRLTDLGLTEQQIKANLVFATDKIGDTMTVGMRKQEAKEWFGTAPPDLSVVARARGADWLYSYLRKFYRNDSSPTGWDNLVYERVAMPHVLYELQGIQALQVEEHNGPHGKEHVNKLVLEKPGLLTPAQYDALVGDLVNYLVYMSEPSKGLRIRLGIITLFFLAAMLVIAYLLKKEYWKDMH